MVLMAANDLAQNLHRLMSNARISSSELARRISVPSDTIKKIRTSKNTNPTLATLKPIANYFNITISQLIGECQGLINELPGTLDNDIKDGLCKIPVISWKDAPLWPNIKNTIKSFYSILGHNLSKLAYGVKIENGDYKAFEIGTVLVVDPEIKYTNNGYVLTHKLNQDTPTIKKLLKNENNYYLETIIYGLNIVQPIAPDDILLGVIIGYEKWVK
jgi:transcriptional regulator with XRE-family HTH domain